ncbi:MAG: hypothetical protein ACE5G0_08115 [Rhodothermales bacterium]
MARFHLPASDGHDRHAYRLRMMGALAATLLLLNLLVQWWPASEGGSFYTLYAAHEGPRITLDEVLQTVQVREQKPPPAPLTPVVIPRDVLLDEMDIVVPDSFLVFEEVGLDREATSEATGSFAGTAAGGSAPGSRRFRCSCDDH